MDPPQCVQNAMMTKDKKPFTYTPGGIDLSEVRSPRMQRRIERNATLGGAGDMPKPPPPPPNAGPLPPSALAAMRPQTQVQVFPSPPPPPMPKGIPPPPPPPSCPLPTQKVTTSDNQVLERPDMTKIIPENPMALLRKTGGPSPRKTMEGQVYQDVAPPAPPQRNFEAQSPRYQPPQPVSPPIQQQQRQPVQAYQAPQQQYQPPSPPHNQYQPPQPQYQPSQPQYQPVQVQRATDSPKPAAYSPPIIERQPTMPPQKNVSSSVGSLYIPPLNQQQPIVASPPTPPERTQVQSPGTPTLKEAPRPWQQKNAQQELPPWARKDEEENIQSQPPLSAPNMQQRWAPPAQPQPPQQQFSPRSPQVQQQSPRSPPAQHQNSFPVHIEIRTGGYQPEPEPSERKPNAVYVTQPVVLQHPGPRIEPPYQGQPRVQQQPQQYQQPRQQPVQQQPPKTDSSGTRIIPIQIEGRTTPATPGGERNLTRQLSWGSQPTQSNSFKVIQKFTRTEDDEEDDTPVTQHSARYQQEMPEQMRRMKVNDNGHFRQGPQQNNAGRNMPVQVEGNGQYVHPSEQVVPEPKKYMGSNIPSRSFKILQAMTAPTDNCANANSYNEEPPSFKTMFNPYNYPYYPPPYWSEYYTNFYPQEQSESSKNIAMKSGRSTPLPSSSYWHEYYPTNYPQEQSDSTSKMSDKSSRGSTRSGRSTPMPMPPPPPYWGYMPPPSPSLYNRPRSTTPKPENTRLRPPTPSQNTHVEEQYQYPMYPPYFDPYYYSYYYGYPPMIPPYPYFHASENEEYSGYSSMDEMSGYNTSRRSSLRRRNSLENGANSVQALKQHFEVRSKSAAPRIAITPTFSQETESFNIPPDKDKADNDEDSDTEVEDNDRSNGNLRSIKSVQNINVYAASDQETESSESEESSSEEDTDEELTNKEQEIIPHQLSVIFEESERGDSRLSRSFRCNSVTSETNTITEQSENEEDLEDHDFLASQNVKYKINLFQESAESFTCKSFGGKRISTFEEEKENFASFSFSTKNSRSTDFSSSIQVEIAEETEAFNEQKDNCDNISCKDLSIDEETSKESNEDWWGVIEKNNNDSIDENENGCDNEEGKADTVNVNDEVVCVKLRQKERKEKEEDIASLDLDNIVKRNSVYDILKDEEEDEENTTFGGSLMRVESFASQLEAIKRDSGLWKFDISFNKIDDAIKEERGVDDEEISTKEKNIEDSVREEGSIDVEESEENDTDSEAAFTEEKAIENIEEASNNSDESEIDFWSQIKNDDDDFKPRRTSYYLNEETTKEIVQNESFNAEIETCHDSTGSEAESCSKSHEEEIKPEQDARDSEDEDTSESERSDEDQKEVKKDVSRNSHSRSRSLEPQTIKERIEALRNSIAKKQRNLSEKEDVVVVKTQIVSVEPPSSKTASTKSSIKSFEEYSEEEELDSGVISDISRHISDNEEFPELRKMTRYERAATHSRLFKLLQDECENEHEEEVKKEDKFSKLSVRQRAAEHNALTPSRSKLSLPLNNTNNNEKYPQVNEKLVEELIQSLLRSKKAQVFKTMPKEKLYAAAVTILQEGIETGETPSEEFSSLLSPLRGDTQSSTPAQTPQEFYGDSNEYKQYYDSWEDAALDIVPSKAFKLLQEHLNKNKLGSIEGFLAKCPKILSSKNIPREILKLIDENDSDSSPLPSPNLPQSNDVTNT